MLLTLNLPRIVDPMSKAVVAVVHASVGDQMKVGSALFDLTVDLSEEAPQDCPPASYYRLVIRETVWLRKLMVDVNDEPALYAPLALFSTEQDEPLDAEPARRIRITTAGILHDWERELR